MCPAYYTSLDWAVNHKAAPVVDVLLRNGADITICGPLVDAETRAFLKKRQQELMAEQKQVEPETIIQETPVVIEESVEQIPETTPWDNLAYGKHGARLHALQQLLKSTKNSQDKKTILVMIQGEVVYLLDVLQYELKHAQALLNKAVKEGNASSEAELAYANAQKHLSALERYLKSLPKATSRKIVGIRLPSKDWTP